MKYITTVKVRSYELDSYNHVNNAIYQNYLEYARMDYLEQIGFRYKDFFEAGYFLYVTHVDIKYKASARLGDTLTVESESVKIKTVQGTFHQTIKNQDGIVCVEADVDWTCVNSNGKPSKIPQEFLVKDLMPDQG